MNAAAYGAAVEGAAFHRPDRSVLRVAGRAPVRMLNGMLTGTIPGPERETEPGVRAGIAAYSTLLTPKGRMVSDLRVLRTDVGDGGGEELLLDVPRAGVAGLLDHFARFLPPRFATVEDVSAEWGGLTVLGPGAAGLLSLHALGLRVEERDLSGLAEGEYRSVETGSGPRVRVVRSGDASVDAFDVLGDRGAVDGLVRALESSETPELGPEERAVLRIEAGRPAFGVDMDAETIPIEAGLGERAIDHRKGCYTGQEVIVRIRDRGRVNRSLRGLRLKGGEPPDPGTTLYAPDARGEKAAGSVTSAADSPRMGPVALGYVRREVEPGGTVRLGAVDGPEAVVVELEGGGWGP